ncbi:MAG: PilZ domain-containing protein [Syntrophobacteraceae bacterium]
MANGREKSERRRAKRISVNLGIKITKAASTKHGRGKRERGDLANLINISHLGAYFEYRGAERLHPGDTLLMDLDVSPPLEIKDMDSGERLPMGGLASIVRTRHNQWDASLGVGVRFLEPLSMKLNSA